MKTKKHDTSWMVSVALMAAIVIVLANTPLGMIQLPIIKATTVHIPVILGAILLGPAAGAILGGVFGICSLISNTMAPTLLSFAFSPFMSTTGIPGAIKAVWISVGCRILIGVAAGWLWILFSKLKVNSIIALPIVGFAGAMVNTITVMGSFPKMHSGTAIMLLCMTVLFRENIWDGMPEILHLSTVRLRACRACVI